VLSSQLRSDASSSQFAPDAPSSARWNDRRNDRCRPCGTSPCRGVAHLTAPGSPPATTPPSPSPRTCTASGIDDHPAPARRAPALAARQATCRCSGRRVDAVEADHLGRIPDRSHTRGLSGMSWSNIPWRGSPFGGKALAVTHAQIAARDGRPRRHDVALDQLSHPAHLQATERSDGLEDDQDTLRVAGQVAQLHIALGDHDLEGVIDPAEPHRHRVRCRPCDRSSALQERELPAATAPVRPKLGSPARA
jgi:hypothetical protein